MQKVVFQLETLTCPSCIKKIENAVSKLEGVQATKVQFHSSKVKVEFDANKATVEHMKDVIVKLGYPVLSEKVS